jgi:hypothetical protein
MVKRVESVSRNEKKIERGTMIEERLRRLTLIFKIVDDFLTLFLNCNLFQI